MNRKEYCNSSIRNKNLEYKQVQKLLKDWKSKNSITGRCVVHHRDDTEECRAYNEAFYERWGIDEDGTFELGKYVQFMTTTDHMRYHNTGKKHSEEAKAKISAALTGDKNPMYNKCHSEEARAKMRANNTWKDKNLPKETCAKISAALTGDKNPNYGKRCPEETKAKISAACKGKQRSEETKEKMREVLSAKAYFYKIYKENGGTKNWNEFQVALKIGDITFEMQPISVFINGDK